MSVIQPPPSTPRLLRTAETAQILTVTSGTVRRLVRDGKLQACRIGGALRIKHDSVLKMLGTTV